MGDRVLGALVGFEVDNLNLELCQRQFSAAFALVLISGAANVVAGSTTAFALVSGRFSLGRQRTKRSHGYTVL